MTKRIKVFQRPKQNSIQKQHTKERGFNQVNFKKNTLEIRKYIVIVIAGRISMFKILVLSLLLVGCQSITIPSDYVYKEIQTRNFDIASWQKISNPSDVYKIYIEGDGYAFNAYGQPTQDPTPKGTLMRELAFGDKSPNVIYLARPCQYVKSPICTQRHWTTARFAPEVINSEYEAIKQIVGDSPIILIGFSGGAQIAGLVARRIVCDAASGQEYKAGERFGMIRFGSRLDVYLPLEIKPQVVVGQTMIAGETIIANLTSGAAEISGEVR